MFVIRAKIKKSRGGEKFWGDTGGHYHPQYSNGSKSALEYLQFVVMGIGSWRTSNANKFLLGVWKHFIA
jgi:hypothetical protein